MDYQEYKPAKTLEPYIKCYYTIACGPNTQIQDQAFATGCIEVMFTLEGATWQTSKNGLFTKTPAIELWGQILQPLSFRGLGPSKIFGIRFYPSAAAVLLKENINLFNDQVIDMTEVVGMSIKNFHERLQEAQSILSQIELANAFLLKKLTADPKTIDRINLIQQVMNEVTQKGFFDNISNVAERYGISSRYLQKIFVQYTGLTPKLYMQINRFQNSLVLLGKQNGSLTDIAYTCGYFDQSHFIREFKSFTGFVPSVFTPENSSAILASPNK